MQISTNSWHYRFMKIMGVRPHWRDNLCSYVRGFVFSLIKLGWYSCITSILISFALFLLYCAGYSLLAGIFGLDTGSVYWLFGAAVWGFICGTGISFVVAEMLNRRKYRAPGPFKQYIIDRHNKVCRMIQFS